MGESAKMERKLHLKLPAAMLATVLRPTGCRSSPEAEASWRLGAAAVAVRELRPKGIVPIFKDIDDYRDDLQTKELHVPLREDDLRLLTQVSVEEGGSRGELARKLLVSAQRIIDDCPGSLNHDGLVALMVARFSPASPVIPAEW
jgi:hypothetical protein